VEVIRERAPFRQACEVARAQGSEVGFVATMGAFHDGHRSLMARAREERSFVAVSIYVNPLQFGPGEDLAGYPRDLDRDLSVAEDEGVDVAFVPSDEEMYPAGRQEVTVDPGPIGQRLEGAARPGHYRGVCTVVAKLFGLVGPCLAYFGEKDAQQVAVIGRMVAALDMPVVVVGCPTVREADGLALSSRNVYLSADEQRAATCLYEALAGAAWLVEGGEREAGVLKAEMARRVGSERLARLDYVAVVDDSTFEEIDRLRGPSRALVAARIGDARLIDNLSLRVGG
jgi:pantoate--beta-alanine ligase